MRTFYHHNLRVYKETLEFIVRADALVESWPPYRRYLGLQLRRAACSIALNIAEGAHETKTKDKLRLYRYARRSAGESVCAIDIAIELRLNPEPELDWFYEKLNTIIAMLTGISKPK